jgi:DNA-binding SARP family transcriptional activator/tetratricopeptide (TPR) repeat protein
VDFGPPRQRAVLAVLLASPGHVVSTEALIDRVWGESPPPAARDSLYVYVTRLRALLKGGAELVRRSNGYALEVEAETVDLHRFRRLCRERAFEQAFQLWAEPLADIRGDWAAQLRLRICEEYLEARLRWAQECLSRGDAADTVAPLMDLAVANPYTESVTVALMRSLAATGRAPEALEYFAKMRQRLADELGTDPGGQLTELHVELLRGEKARPAPAGPVPRQLPADISAFTGRSAELAMVSDQLDAALAAGDVPIVCIRGAPGVGKSAFAIHLAHRLAPRFPDGQLHVNLHGASASLTPLSAIEVIGRFLRALGLESHRLPVEADEAGALLRSTLAGRKMLIVLDDAADVDQVRQLLPGTAGCAVLLTSRRVLSGLPDRMQLKLETYEAEDSAALMRRLCGDRATVEDAATAEVARLCGGLPLALRIAATRLNSRPSWRMGTLAGHLATAHRRLDALHQPDASVRASFAVSFEELRSSKDRCDHEAAEVLPLLGIAPGDDLSPLPVASLLARDRETTQMLLEHLADASLLECRTPGRYRLHDLLRLYALELAESLCTAEERAEALGRVMRFYIGTAWATTEMLMPGAERLDNKDSSWAQGAITFATAAEALSWWEAERPNAVAAALQASALPDVPDAAVSQLAQAMIGFFRARGYVDDYISLNLAAARGAFRSGDRAAYATALSDLGMAHDRKGDLVNAEREQVEAMKIFAELGDWRAVATCRGQLGILYCRLGRFTDGARCHQGNLSHFREIGDLRGQAISLNNLGVMNQQLHRLAEALEYHAECLELRRHMGDRRGEAIGLANIGIIHDELGDLARATQHQEAALELFLELGDLDGEAQALKNLAATHIKARRYSEGESLVLQADELLRRLGFPFGRAQAHHQAALAYLHHGQAPPARPHLLLALELYEQVASGEAAEIRKLLGDQ